MSSTYRIICLSHDPAHTTGDEYRSAEAAERDIATGIDDHPDCDLMIGRWSGALVEIGCPVRRTTRPDGLTCYHGGTDWTGSEWLRLLAAVYMSTDPVAQKAITYQHQQCYPWQRLRRLRLELGITVTPDSPADGDALGGTEAPAPGDLSESRACPFDGTLLGTPHEAVQHFFVQHPTELLRGPGPWPRLALAHEHPVPGVDAEQPTTEQR